MKQIVKKNQIIIAALAVMIAAAGSLETEKKQRLQMRTWPTRSFWISQMRIWPAPLRISRVRTERATETEA